MPIAWKVTLAALVMLASVGCERRAAPEPVSAAGAVGRSDSSEPSREGGSDMKTEKLPRPAPEGVMSLEDAIRSRRSLRSFSKRQMTPEEISGLLFSAAGVTDPATGKRAAPSAGALYPIEVYAVTPSSISRYLPEEHALAVVREGDRRGDLSAAALGQSSVATAPLSIVLTGVVGRTAAKYGERARRYVLMEAGHIGQNALLEATAMGLNAVPVGAFDDAGVERVLGCGADESALYIICVGPST